MAKVKQLEKKPAHWPAFEKISINEGRLAMTFSDSLLQLRLDAKWR
jgi:hypothetical protein